MKKRAILFIGILICLSLILIILHAEKALSQDSVNNSSLVEKNKNASHEVINKVREGVNETEYEAFKKDLKENLEKINEKIQPAAKIIFGMESGFSLQFLIAVLFWIILLIFIGAIVRDIFKVNSFIAYLISAIISSIALNGFGERLINVIAKSYYALVLTGLTLIAILIIDLIFKIFFKKSLLSFLKSGEAKEIAYKKAMIRKTVDELDKKKLDSYSDGGGI